MTASPFSIAVKPDWEGLVRTIQRKGTLRRVHFIELFLDREIQRAIAERFGLLEDWAPEDAVKECQLQVRIQRFFGYDFVRASVDGLEMPLRRTPTADTAALARTGGRVYMEEHAGPITNGAMRRKG